MEKKTRLPWWAAETLFAVITLFVCFFMLELSSEPKMKHIWQMAPKYMLLNLLTIGVIWALFLIFSNRVWLSNLLCSLVFGIIAIVNYYVVQFHGMPLSFLELRNFKTAMNVISGYRLKIDFCSGALLLITIALVLLALWLRRAVKGKRLKLKGAAFRDGILIAAVFCLCWFGYFSENPVKPQRTVGWLWSEAYYKYGYTACTIESFVSTFDVVNKPEGYSEEAVEAIEIPSVGTLGQEKPDIILILNESFYDLAQITDLEADGSYMKNIESMDNLLRGYAVVPYAGGGTNCTEYELLTSNSLQLMPGVTPFNVLDLTGANSIVSHLNALGYSTTGTHSESGANYSRSRGYSALGFQNIYFEESYTDVEYYYKRWYETDESLYRNLIRWYEQAPEESPRFMYMLTIQNHGDWNLNPTEYDTVHALRDYGEYDEPVDEFLTCVSMSDEAFKGLTDYFAQVDRPVIVCMLGDHSPNFAEKIVDEQFEGYDRTLRLRKTPLIIWANYPLEDVELGTIGVNSVIPTLLEIAHMESAPYYDYLLGLKKEIPILTSYDVYYDAEGSMYRYDDGDSPYKKAVDDYFLLEYSNISPPEQRHFYWKDAA